jgi:UDP-N-acetylglucosamine 2-epimerase (non-hydrolysing)
MKIVVVAGARPNFVKVAPILREFETRIGNDEALKDISVLFVHTGQHYDANMSKIFFDELGIMEPHICLDVGSKTHAIQTAEIMMGFENVCVKEKPDLVIVVGDVNSTVACSLVAVKMGIKVAHIEAGLRSYDRRMPEEINRVVTDSISDYLFTTCREASETLGGEGVSEDKIFFTGNVMADTLIYSKERASEAGIIDELRTKGICDGPGKYAVLTLHRPSNVDNRDKFEELIAVINDSVDLPVLFPVHPRTMNKIKSFDLDKYFNDKISILEPLGYLDFLCIMMNAKFVMTDSGGIQEETTVLGVPCLTLRENTERPITVDQGTNILAGVSSEGIKLSISEVLEGERSSSKIPELWDGKAAQRIVDIILKKHINTEI